MKCAGCLFAAILALSSFWAADAWAAEKPKLVVLLIESRGSGLKADEVVSLSDYLAGLMAQNGQYQVLPLPSIRKRKAGASPIKLMGGPPDLVLSTAIHRVGRQCLLVAGLYDAQAATMNQAVTGRTSCKPDVLMEAIGQMAHELAAGASLPASVPVGAVFLMESRRSGLRADEMVGLTDYLAAILVERRALRLIPRDSLLEQLAFLREVKRQDAVYFISSKLGRIGKHCLITSQVMDSGSKRMVKGVSGRFACDPDSVVEGISALAQELADELMALRNPAKGKRLVPHPVVPAKATPPAPTKASSAP